MTELIVFIKELGFPIFAAVWLFLHLWKTQPMLTKIACHLEELVDIHGQGKVEPVKRIIVLEIQAKEHVA